MDFTTGAINQLPLQSRSERRIARESARTRDSPMSSTPILVEHLFTRKLK